MKKDEQQENAHKQLMEDPKYAVHVHDAQINRMADYLEKLAEKIQDDDKRIKALEDALYKLEETLNGDLEEIINGLISAERLEAMSSYEKDNEK